MAERILRSPGVTTRELDLSAPGRVRPQGIPAGIVGTAEKGPAFVPVNFATATDFLNLFGETKGKHFGAMAVNEWMRNARSGIYLRVLGAGDGAQRNASTKVTSRAGFFVGDKIRNQSDTSLEQDGSAIGRTNNPYAGAALDTAMTLAGTAGSVATGANAIDRIHWTFGTLSNTTNAFAIVDVLTQNNGRTDVAGGLIKMAIHLIDQQGASGNTYTVVSGPKVQKNGVDVKDYTGIADVVYLVDLRNISGDDSTESHATNAAHIRDAVAHDSGNAGHWHTSVRANHIFPAGAAKIELVKATYNNLLTTSGADTVVVTQQFTGAISSEPVVTGAGQAVSAPTKNNVARTAGKSGGEIFTRTLTLASVPGDHSTLTITPPAGGTNIVFGFHSAGSAVASQTVNVNTSTYSTVDAIGGLIYDTLRGNSAGTTTTGNGALGAGSAALGMNLMNITWTTSTNVLTIAQQATDTVAQPVIAKSDDTALAGAGRTMFLGCEMFAADSLVDYFGSAQADVDKTQTGTNILRGVVMFASGVMPGLAQEDTGTWESVAHASVANGTYGATQDEGSHTGYLKDGKFIVIMNGFNETASGNSAFITGSFDPTSPIYFGKVMNTDPTKLQEKGHYLYAHYDIPTGLATHQTTSGAKAFLAQGAYNPHAQGSASLATQFHTSANYRPSFENWRMKFEHAFTPWITSQTLGSSRKKLFRFHMLDAGSAGNGQVKISIVNIQKSTDLSSNYGRFDVQIRSASDLDAAPVVLQSFAGVNLNPASDRYIARVIGDQNTFFDFERAEGKQKLVTDGLYENQSQYVRVEVVDSIESGTMEPSALPCGFQGKHHLVLAGDALANSIDLEEPPLPFRQTVAVGEGKTLVADSRFYWGTQYQDIRSASLRNKESGISSLVNNLTKWFPAVGTHPAWVGDNKGAVAVGTTTAAMLDANVYNNNEFSLENLWIQCTNLDTSKAVDPTQWKEAVYIRDGNSNGYRPYNGGSVSTGQSATTDYFQAQEVVNSSASSGQTKSKSVTNGWRYLDVSKDFGQNASKKYLKFTVPMQGGWDGLDIFDADKSLLNEASSFREMDSNTSSDLGGPNGPTTASFRKALDILAEKSDVDIQLLATPGLRSAGVTDYAIDKTEDRFDALYIMDMPAYDHESYRVTQSSQEVSVLNSSQELVNRNLDTSFAATYFPDLVVQDGANNVVAPPSVAVLGAMSLNDSVAHPWFAPAGFARGALQSTIETAVKLSRSNMDTLYDSDINPITSFPQSGESVVIFGQKTMLQAQSALDRVNVRRLLIDIRRKVRTVSNQILFEPNREATLTRFSSLVNPILGRIQQQQGLDRYKVIIDTTTTTQQDVENNTIRGKIFLQPTKSIEFISLDFVVTNAGAEI